MAFKLHLCVGVALLSAVACVAQPARAWADAGLVVPVADGQAATADGPEVKAIMDRLKAQLTGMGYEPKIDGKHATIDAGDFVINFNLSGDNATLFAYSFFAVTPEQAAKAPLQDLLAFNDDADAYFSVHLTNKKVDSVSLNRTMPVKDMSPQTLRRMIDRINGYGHDNLTLFAPNNWK